MKKDTFCSRFHSEFLRSINISLSDKKVHNQFIHVFFPNFYVIELFLPLIPCYYFL